MHTEIIAVGTEILLGQIVNTNAAFIARRLAGMGIDVYHQTVVGDNQQRLTEVIEIAAKRNDLVILMGGLGSTPDDLTKQTVARFLGKNLVEDAAAMKKIINYYAASEKEMTANNRLQAQYIEGSTPLKNETGFAVGEYYQNENGCDFLLLPGPPSELQPMFTNFAQPLLHKQYNHENLLFSRVLRFFGIGESLLVTKISDLIDEQSNPTLAPYAKTSEVTLRLTASAVNEQTAKELLDKMEKKVCSRVGEYMYGYGDDNTLVATVVAKLMQENLSITAAESLTAGAFQAALGNVPGVSHIFPGGFVTYANNAKSSLLDIPADLIQRNGVVSETTAKWMAQKAKEKMKTDIGISFTGVAGPEALEGNEAGTVWIGLAFKEQPVQAELYHFARQRSLVRERSVLTGLDWIRRELLK
ncbi:competence/damage-inducible protein A [Liquorilactobacillus capillatus]|nr:competence/damage-inducible protein A [Liquorilactobacillus capillatus]